MKIFLKLCYILLLFTTASILYSNILYDLTHDHTIIIEIKNEDTTVDTKEDQTDDLSFGNKWFSRRNIYIFSSVEAGLSGTKDFFGENFLFKYRFKSKNKHAFSIRNYHFGYAPGIFSQNFIFFNFAVLGGFEYLFKIFNNISGFFIWLDIGGCNGGISFNAGIGIGNRINNGFEFWITYLHNVGIFSRLDFHFLLFDILTLRGRLGIDSKFYGINNEIFTFMGGLFIGLFVKNIFKIELGGGFTFNDYGFFSGFGRINLGFNIL